MATLFLATWQPWFIQSLPGKASYLPEGLPGWQNFYVESFRKDSQALFFYLLMLFDKLIYRWTVLTGTPELYASTLTTRTHQNRYIMYEFLTVVYGTRFHKLLTHLDFFTWLIFSAVKPVYSNLDTKQGINHYHRHYHYHILCIHIYKRQTCTCMLMHL